MLRAAAAPEPRPISHHYLVRYNNCHKILAQSRGSSYIPIRSFSFLGKRGVMQVVSANRLSDGLVVYLDSKGNWVESLVGAAVFSAQPEIEAALQQAQAAVAENKVVEAIAVPVEQGTDGLHAISLRNAIRELGPTVAYKTSPHDGFGSNRSKTMDVIESNNPGRDLREKPGSTFSHPTLTARS